MSDLSPPIPFLDPESDSKDGDDNNLSLPFSFFLSVRTTPAAGGQTDCEATATGEGASWELSPAH